MCPPGHISFWGVDPCQPCPIASYQRRSGQIGCEACPDGMRTRITGATSISLCTSNFQTPAIPEKRGKKRQFNLFLKKESRRLLLFAQVLHSFSRCGASDGGPPNTLVLHCCTQLFPSWARVPSQGVLTHI